MADSTDILNAALAYLDAGLCVLPARVDQKRPAVPTWKQYQRRLPTPVELHAWFANGHALCILTGTVSGNNEMIDFDAGGALFDRWAEIVRAEAPGLLERLVIERTQRGGYHVDYRCAEPVCGNMKLAQRLGADGRPETLIETRGEGGLFLCAPSPGYRLLQGAFTDLPVLSADERDTLLSAAWTLNEAVPAPEPVPSGQSSLTRPGDDFAERGDVRAVLVKAGWTLAKSGENEYWRRPGKASGWSATLKDRVLYVFSSNAAPFEPGKAYGPFGVYTLLEHNGDYSASAGALRALGYGQDAPLGVDISGIVAQATPQADPPTAIDDPGPVPMELLRIPGFVSEVMDFCLQTAPYPSQVMAFCGAVAAQSFLAARKVRDPGDNRTNLYLLGLGYSSAGKDWPRRINTRLLHDIGLGHCAGDKFASGEGLQDALFLNPAMLFQTDEIDTMLQSISKSRDARYENLMGTLLTMYTSSASVYPMRRKASKENPGAIDQPSLTVFGTAVPTHYYEALSSRMLTNGFFARMIVLEAGARPEGQEPCIPDLPPRLIETGRWWADFQPGERVGNLYNVHPVPKVVSHTDEAKALLVETRRAAEAEYRRAESRSDEVGTTVWGRVSENVRKLALLYAVSAHHTNPVIGGDAVAWASTFVRHQTRRMLFMAGQHVADGEFDAECLKVIRKLRAAPEGTLTHSVLLKRMKMESKRFQDLVNTLVQRGDVEMITTPTAGRPGVKYQLRMALSVKEEGQE
ncbi:MAG: bifunctional DNA primase/polymerase [Planctomycetota bacterium]|nr:bifunctional DNA primase/polymerase [Planctomycetota bacterium]